MQIHSESEFIQIWLQSMLTRLSFAIVESFATGLFCFKLPRFRAGTVVLLREGSAEDQPEGLPSSPPATKLQI